MKISYICIRKILNIIKVSNILFISCSITNSTIFFQIYNFENKCIRIDNYTLYILELSIYMCVCFRFYFVSVS